MRVIRLFATCGLVLFYAQSVFAQTAAEIFKEMDARKQASYSNVQNYTQKKQTMGLCSLEYFEKETTESRDGRGMIEYMRMVPISEITQRNSTEPGMADMSANEMEMLANQLRMVGPQMDTAMRAEMEQAELPGGIGQMLMAPRPDEPWTSANPNDMVGMYATMLEGAAKGKRQDAANAAQAESDAATMSMAEIAERTRVVGRETVRNREAFLLLSDDLNYTQEENGQSFTLNTIRVWVATDDYVPLKMSMEGSATEGGKSRDLKIEREDMEYRPVPGCPGLQEPFRSVMRIAGVLDDNERAQMEEAQAKMAEMELQLNSLPPGQKEMIMRQMGPQLEMFRNMAAGNGIEVVSEVVAMRCNTGVPTNMEYAATLPGNMMEGCGPFGGMQGGGASPAVAGGGGASGGASGSSSGGATGGASGSSSSNSGSNQASGSGGGSSGSSSSNSSTGSASANSATPDSSLVSMIQESLQALSYDPGTTNGDLTRETVMAITRFEAANNMPVTGKVTPQLAGILQAKVAAR